MQTLKTKVISLVMATFLILATAIPALAGVPVASSFSTYVPTNRQAALLLLGSDPDLTSLVYAITGGPSHGALTNLNTATGAVVYTPVTDYTGADSFTYTVTSGGQTSSAGTVTLTVTSAKTTVSDTITDTSGAPRSGVVTFILTQGVTTPSGITPKGSTVSAALNSSGVFSAQVYPSKSLDPEAYYQVWFADKNTLNRELLGVYEIPLSLTSITLAPYRVTDTNLAARYSFISAAQANALGASIASIYLSVPADNEIVKYDSTSGKLEPTGTVSTSATTLVNTTQGMAINSNFLDPAAALQVNSTTRGILPPRLTTTQRNAMTDFQQGNFFYNTTTNRPNWFSTGWNEIAYLTDIPAVPMSSVFGRTGAVVAVTNDYTWAQVDKATSSLADITTRSAADLNSGTLPLARLAGITNTEIDAAAAIAWTKLSKSGSSLADLATRSASDLSSGTVPMARLGSGGAGAGAKVLTDANTFVNPDVLGLIDALSSTFNRIPLSLNSHTIGDSYLQQSTDRISITGTGSGPRFDIYSAGAYGDTDYVRASIYADPTVVEIGTEVGGSFASQSTSVRLKANGATGDIQFETGLGILWKQTGVNFVPQNITQGIGLSSLPLGFLRMGSGGGVEFFNSNVKQGIMRSDSLNHFTFRKGDNSGGAIIDTGIVNVTDDAYASGWNASTEVPTKNAIYDKIESISGFDPTAGVIDLGQPGSALHLDDGTSATSIGQDAGTRIDIDGSGGVINLEGASSIGVNTPAVNFGNGAYKGCTSLSTNSGGDLLCGGFVVSAYQAANFTNATTTLNNTSLSASVASTATYSFVAQVYVSNSTAADGFKVDFGGGSATFTNFVAGSNTSLVTGVTTSSTSTFSNGSLTGSNLLTISGSIEVDSGGTIIIRAAENTHTVGTLTVMRGSSLVLTKM